MARKFTPHSLEWLKKKMELAGGFSPDQLTKKVEKDISKVEFDFENCTCSYNDGYNGCEIISGYHIAPNGLPFLGVVAGGDWEIPVFFMIYWDDKDLRGYIPTDGNTWNTDTKKAYGNEMDYYYDKDHNFHNLDINKDQTNLKKRYPEAFKNIDVKDICFEDCGNCDPVKILLDIAKRITPR